MRSILQSCIFTLRYKKFIFRKGAICEMCQRPLKFDHSNVLQSKKYSIYTSQETIFSLSSGHGKCGVAVIRVSGTKAAEALKTLGRFKKLPEPRYAELRRLYDHISNVPIDHGLILWFPGPKSFTGEDCVEFQVHGGPAVVAAIATALGKIPGLRQAEAGEFTKRAFLNNKLDLTEIEGLGDLIHAETEAQRRQALRQMEGSLGKMYSDWRSRIIKMMANVEAFIDFSEDENIEEDVLEHVNKGVEEILKEIESHLHDNRRGERLRSGVRVTIIGEPNVGKSSLMNLIAQRPAAIVSDIAGTTRDIVGHRPQLIFISHGKGTPKEITCFTIRDYIRIPRTRGINCGLMSVESAVNIGSYPVLLSDTAGLRQSNDVIEKEGVRRAIERAKDSDLKAIMLSAIDIEMHLENNLAFDLRSYVNKTLKELGVLETNSGILSESITEDEEHPVGDIIVIVNKSDLMKSDRLAEIVQNENAMQICSISCITEAGIEELLSILKSKIENLCGDPLAGNPSLTQARHRQHLTNCVTYLKTYQNYIDQEDIVLAAQSLRKATREIGKITGKITSEDIFDVIFRDFCIGK